VKIEQRVWSEKEGRAPAREGAGAGVAARAQMALIFAATSFFSEPDRVDELRQRFPHAHVLGCSTSGQIHETEILDEAPIVTAVEFERTDLRTAEVRLGAPSDSLATGKALAQRLPHDGLVHVLVLCDGLHVNGSALVRGLVENLPRGVTLSGGLAGDGDRFQRTLVCCDGDAESGKIVALGFYGDHLKVGCGSMGGWDPFGPDRLVTRAKGNVLYELDGRSALELYKRYLGEHAARLPASALMFPLALRTDDGKGGVIRTILAVDERQHSMTFAGDVPEGSTVRLMKATFERLIDGAIGAARACDIAGSPPPELAILISCVGRKLVLKQRVEEEVEAVRDVLGPRTPLAGFYSYGEIAPFRAGSRCELHNQTMTLTTFREN
jgi:hypothetical protein